MPSPFPGMDPYLEAQGSWPDFHNSLLTYCRDAISDTLPDRYVARIDEQIRLVSPEGVVAEVRPDVIVARGGAEGRRPGRVGGVAMLEPVTLRLLRDPPEEVRDTRIEIRRLPEMALVTVIEVLSPSNKAGVGRVDYLEKRRELIDQPVNLVEIDLLLGGQRLPMTEALPAGDYYAFVARSGRRPDCDVYGWSVRDPLPIIPIPLEAPDPDIPLNLADLFALAYERGRYARTTDYAAPLGLPLRAEDSAWAGRVARGDPA